MKIEELHKSACCGCSACYTICPVNAISMKEDYDGFLYPYIDRDICIVCGKCDTHCPSLVSQPITNGMLEAYAAVNNDKNIVEQSSSGGIFTLLAESVLKKNGCVFGAAFDSNWEVRHTKIESVRELNKLRGSKYVQSIIGDIYKDVKYELNTGRLVLFSGTPCQCEALLAYINQKKPNNLVLVDFICHGVPSPKVWKKYINLISNGKEIQNISFRSKNISWEIFLLELLFKDSSKYMKNYHDDLYMQGFLWDLYLRKSCYNCKFRNKYRKSDVTIADYWGVKKIHPEMYNPRGTSLVLVHSDKGNNILRNIDAKVILTDYEKAIAANCAYIKSPIVHSKREVFFQKINDGEDMLNLIKIYTKEPFSVRIKKYLSNVNLLRQVYKKVKIYLGNN